MRCTNNRMDPRIRRKSSRKRRRRRQQRMAAVLITLAVLIGAAAAGGLIIWGQFRNYTAVYEADHYNTNVYQGTLFSSDLCVTADEVTLEGFEPDKDLHAAGLFDLEEQKVLCGYKIFDKVYPASTTKIMTALLALKNGNMDDVVTVSSHATDFNWDESTCGLRTGDKVTLYDLVCGLLLHSGNDCGTAIAEHIAGSEEAFAEMMNEEAAALGATGTHFMNPHGLHDENHYTTVYDIYLMLNEALSYPKFAEVMQLSSYNLTFTRNGEEQTIHMDSTDQYMTHQVSAPKNVTVLGGKTGTTGDAGSCLALVSQNAYGEPFISIVLHAPTKTVLYENMNQLLSQINS